MAETPGYNCELAVGGTPAALTNEACTEVSSGAYTDYQVTDSTKRLLDPDTAIVVEEDTGGGYATVASTLYTIDYYTGTITFTPALGASSTVRIASGNYIPPFEITQGRASNLTVNTELLDTTTYADAQANSGHRVFIAGLQDAAGDLEVVDDGLADYDTGGGSERKLLVDAVAGTKVLLTIQPDGSNNVFRTWAILTATSVSDPVDGLVTTNFSWVAAGRGAENTPFSWAA